MQNEKLQINLGEGVTKAEVILREGVAIKELEPKAPVKTNLSGTMGAVFEYLLKRLETTQFTQGLSHIIVNRDKIKLSLIINEDDEYTRGQVDGTLQMSPKFIEFGINTGKVWTPTELGMFFKMNRAFFPDRTINMKLVSELMNFSATINNKIERSVKENGDRTDNFAQIVNSNLPSSFTLQLPIFKGMEAETLEVETFAQINGREVAFTLLSPGANQTIEEVRDRVIDKELEAIKEIAPKIAIIEV